MVVARTKGGEPVIVDRLREMVQLATGVDQEGRLTTAAKNRALRCLKRFGQRLRHTQPGAVRAVGTNTLRAAQDADEFLIEAEHALGHSIETISGIEEARLIFLGVTQTLPEPDMRRLVVDIGGGSTELIFGEGVTPRYMESLYMGCLTFSQAHFTDGLFTEDNWRRAELAALQELEPIRERFQKFHWQEVVGTSGTIRAIDSLIINYGWSSIGITSRALRKLRDIILRAGRTDRLSLSGLRPDRQTTVAAGVAILLALFRTLPIRSMGRSEGALREGLLYDLLGRICETDIRLRSITALAERAQFDKLQADRVEQTAITLLAQVAEHWNIGSGAARQFLTWAARLHEIGLGIAHNHYHRHGEYIVGHADLPGFSRPEQQVLATLVRAHRRKFPSAKFVTLPHSWPETAERLAILLRLAVALHRSRSPLPLPTLELDVVKKELVLRFPIGWLIKHPLTQADLVTERSYLETAGYRLSFE